MSSISTGYDLSVTTFSPDGRVFQIEYAAKAIDNSGTVVAIKCKDDIVMGVEKLIVSKMMLPGSNQRIHSVHRHSGMIMNTLYGDCWRVALKGKELNVKFTPGVQLGFKNFALQMVEYTLSQVNILVNWSTWFQMSMSR